MYEGGKMKIYSDDPNLPYKTTKLNWKYTKTEIDAELAKWGVKDSMWHMDLEHNTVFVEFKFAEVIDGINVSPVVHVDAPAIWNHTMRNKTEEINWNISFRIMYWFIHTHLAAAYVTQSSKTVAFLPYIKAGEEGEQLSKIVLRNLEKIQSMPALEAPAHGKVIIE